MPPSGLWFFWSCLRHLGTCHSFVLGDPKEHLRGLQPLSQRLNTASHAMKILSRQKVPVCSVAVTGPHSPPGPGPPCCPTFYKNTPPLLRPPPNQSLAPGVPLRVVWRVQQPSGRRWGLPAPLPPRGPFLGSSRPWDRPEKASQPLTTLSRPRHALPGASKVRGTPPGSRNHNTFLSPHRQRPPNTYQEPRGACWRPRRQAGRGGHSPAHHALSGATLMQI